MNDGRGTVPNGIINVKHIISEVNQGIGRKEETMHSIHFIYGYMVSYIMVRTIQIAREETRCHQYMGYSFRMAARGPLYAPPTDRIAHTTAIVTPVVEQCLDREKTPTHCIIDIFILDINNTL